MFPRSLVLLLVLVSPLVSQTTDRVPASFVPANVDLYLEVADPVKVFESAKEAPWRPILDALGLADEIEKNEDLQNLYRLFHSLAPALGGRVGVGMRAQRKEPWFVIVSSNEGKLSIDDAIERLREFNADLRPSELSVVADAEWCDIEGLGHLASKDGALLWSNHRFLLRRCLKVKPGKSMVDDDGYRDLVQREGDASIIATGDLAGLLGGEDGIPPGKDLFDVLLLDGLRDELRSAESAQLAASLTPWPKLSLNLECDESPPWARGARRYPPLPPAADYTAVIRLDRDLAELWRRRRELVPESGHQGLAEFEQGMNTFFSGFPFDEVMAHLKPGIELYAETNRPAGSDRPDVLLPGFAMVVETDFSRELEDRFRVAFQTAIGIINAGAAEEQRQPMLLYTRTFDGIEAQGARFLTDPRDGRKGLEYNLTPSVAFVGNRLLFSTSMSFLGTLVPVLRARQIGDGPDHGVGDEIAAGGASVAAALRQNLDVLTENRVLEEGEDEEEARLFLTRVLDATSRIGRVSFSRRGVEGRAMWTLEVTGAATDR